jgi:hypothetical protein
MSYNKYILKELNDQEFGFLSLSIDYTRLDEYLFELEKDLKKRGFKGKLIFDLLMNNGINDRYYNAFFNGENFELSSLNFITNLNDKILKTSSEYYLANFNLIQESFMSKQSKFIIKKELQKSLSKQYSNANTV